MRTLRQFAQRPEVLPTVTSWYLGDLGEARGKQELFTRQSPQRLKVLREHALIESAVSSNRLEGVEVDQSRVATLIFGTPLLRDRDEEEVRGYRDALKLVHEQGAKLAVSEETLRHFHWLCRGQTGEAGQYKERDTDIIQKYPDGRERVRFRTVRAKDVPASMVELMDLWSRCLQERWVPPLLAMAAFNLDFLCVHPFRDGNGRVSRLLLLLQCYHLGFEVGRYISLERLIEQNRERYYETLEMSSHRWHEGKHDPWPYVGFVLYMLKLAYREFEERVGEIASPRGAKTALVEAAIDASGRDFSLTDLETACPGVSRDMIRFVLRRLQESGEVKCLGRGPGARWRKRGSTLERG